VVVAAAADTLVTGTVTFIRPSLFCWLILGNELAASGRPLGALFGLAMLAVGLGAWPAPVGSSQAGTALRALMAFNVLATVYLAYMGAGGLFTGILLWPAVALHAFLSVLLGYAWLMPE